jgi:hypothetical protein
MVEMIAAIRNTAAGAPKGQRRRHSKGNTTIAAAGTANQGELRGARSASSRNATSSAHSTAASTINTSTT